MVHLHDQGEHDGGYISGPFYDHMCRVATRISDTLVSAICLEPLIQDV